MNRRVDQKLHLAKLALASINANGAAETALAEAALFHLYIAYRAYLRETLEHFKLTVTVDSALQAVELLRAQDLHSADIDELAKLEQSGEWPAQMCAAYASAMSAEITPEPAASAAIVLRDVTAQLDGSVCAEWLQQFHAQPAPDPASPALRARHRERRVFAGQHFPCGIRQRRAPRRADRASCRQPEQGFF